MKKFTQKYIYNSRIILVLLMVISVILFFAGAYLNGIPGFAFFYCMLLIGLYIGKSGLKTRNSDENGELMMSYFDICWISTSIVTVFFAYQSLYLPDGEEKEKFKALQAGWLGPWYFFLGLRLSKALFDIHIRYKKINPNYQDAYFLRELDIQDFKVAINFISTIILLSLIILLFPPLIIFIILNLEFIKKLSFKKIKSSFFGFFEIFAFAFVWYVKSSPENKN